MGRPRLTTSVAWSRRGWGREASTASASAAKPVSMPGLAVTTHWSTRSGPVPPASSATAEAAIAVPPSTRLARSLEPSTVHAPYRAVSMSQLARASSETAGAAE